jgi:AbiV family abortive infection protein
MRAKAIRDLAQLTDRDLFPAVAEGLALIGQNATRLEEDARVLYDQERPQGYRALLWHAKEEAAKALSLLDAVRCPRQPVDVFSRQLRAFNQHLAKGVYAECYRGRPATFGEVVKHTDMLRQQYYLDGPEGLDWIFRNTILDKRESGLYVDYIETDDRHLWIAPVADTSMIGSRWPYMPPNVLTVVRALEDVGCFDAKALEVIASTWRPVAMTPDFHWDPALRALNRKTIEAMDAKGLLKAAPPEIYAKVIDGWLFPLYSLDLAKEIPVEKADLRAQQDEWLYREMGVSYDW